MTTKARQKKKSLREKFMQMMKNILKVSSCSLSSMNLRASGSPPEKHTATKQTTTSSMDVFLPVVSHHPRANPQFSQNLEQNDDSKSSRSYPLNGSDGGGEIERSSYVMIQGIDDDRENYDGRFSDHVKRFYEKNTSELKTTITNLKASDYIRRFHERNKDETIDFPFVLPPPPIPQARFPPR